MNDLFNRDRNSPECLSRFTVSLLVLGELPAAGLEAARSHIAQCEHCRSRVESEQEKVARASTERVPESLVAAAQAKRSPFAPWIQWMLATVAAAAVVLLAILLLPAAETGDEPGVRTKGKPSLEVLIRRDQVISGDPLPLDRAKHLRAGDELRLRAVGAGGRWIAVVGCDTGCTSLFRGATPEDGWLPLGLTATAGSSALHLLICDRRESLEESLPPAGQEERPGSPGAGCSLQTWNIEVAP